MRPLKLVPDNTNLPFLRYRNPAMAISVALIIASIVLCVIRGFNLGTDFVGGPNVRVTFTQPVDPAELRERVAALNVGEPTVQQFAGGREMAVRTPLPEGGDTAADAVGKRIRDVIVKNYPGARIDSVETVSGKVSQELFRTGAIALALAMAGIAMYIWFRFEWQFGVGALFALVHDVVLTLGFFSLTQLEFDLNVIAALLTIIGYSLNDTIVTYDRIRENLRKYRRMDIRELLDLSVNETLSRTVVTSLSLILALGLLLVLGPDVIFGFTAAMFLGILVGTFSSIYVAAPILLWLGVKPDSFVRERASAGAAGEAERVTARERP